MSLFKEIYLYASMASVLIPIIAGVRNYKMLTKPFKFLLYFFILAFVSEIQSEIFRQTGDGNNQPGLHIYTVIEFLAFSLLFYMHTQKKGLRLLIVINILILVTIAVVSALKYGLRVPNDLSRGYAAASLLLYTVVFLYYLFTIDDTRYLQEHPMFWICIGALIYFASNSPYFLSKLALMQENLKVEWLFHLAHGSLNIIAYCLYAQSFRCFRKLTVVEPQPLR